MEKKYEWQESKTYTTISNFGVIVLLLGLLTMIIIPILSILNFNIDAGYGIMSFFFSLFLGGIILLIANIFSTAGNYSIKFNKKVEHMIKVADSKKDLENIRDYIHEQAINEKGRIRLKYPENVKRLLQIIESQIDILRKIENKK